MNPKDYGCYLKLDNRLTENEGDQWIMVFPRGTFYIEKYAREVSFDDKFFKQIAESFDNELLSKPKLDKDHAFGESYGDVLGYKITPEGMMFNIKLNTDGIEAVRERKYSYISPAFGVVVDTQKKKGMKLLSISLTNFPALEGNIPSLQSQLELKSELCFDEFEFVGELKQKEERKMITLAKTLGLNPEATEDGFVEAVTTLKTNLDSKVVELDKANKNIVELTAKLTDTEKKVLELNTLITESNLAKAKQEAEVVITEAIKLGKVHPAVKDIYLNRFLKDPETVKDELSKIPENFSGQKSSDSNINLSSITEEQKKKMIKAELDPNNKEDVEIYLKRQEAK